MGRVGSSWIGRGLWIHVIDLGSLKKEGHDVSSNQYFHPLNVGIIKGNNYKRILEKEIEE